MANKAIWDWYVGLAPAERVVALGIEDRAWLSLFEFVYIKTHEADQTAMFQWDYLDHQYASFLRSQTRQRRRPSAASSSTVLPTGLTATTEERELPPATGAGDKEDGVPAELAAGLQLLAQARLLTARDGEAWSSLTLDEQWVAQPQLLFDCIDRASGGRFLRAAPAHGGGGSGAGRLQGSSVPWLQEAEVIHVGTLNFAPQHPRSPQRSGRRSTASRSAAPRPGASRWASRDPADRSRT